MQVFSRLTVLTVASAIALSLASGAAYAQKGKSKACSGLPGHAALLAALDAAVATEGSGLNHEMWATVVNRDGRVCAVAFSGANRGSQWPGSRVISAQKANTANAFSLDGLALSTANLYSAASPGGSLYGLQHSNPVDTAVAYGGNGHAGGNANNYGRPNDPLVGNFVGGVNVFGGGLGLYNGSGSIIGGLGVSGDTVLRGSHGRLENTRQPRPRQSIGRRWHRQSAYSPGQHHLRHHLPGGSTGRCERRWFWASRVCKYWR